MTEYGGYTKIKNISFSKDNLDLFDAVSKQSNQSAFVCDAIRFYLDFNTENPIKALKDKNESLKEKLETQDELISLLLDKLSEAEGQPLARDVEIESARVGNESEIESANVLEARKRSESGIHKFLDRSKDD